MAATVVAGNRLARRWARIAEAPPVAEEARLFRGSAPIGGHGSGRESVGATVGKNSRSAARCRKHPLQKNMSLRSQCAHWLWQSVVPAHCTPCFVSGGALSANSGRKYPKNAAKTHGFGILCAAGVPLMWKIFCHANQMPGFNAVLSHRLCACSRWPLTRARAGLAQQGWLLRLPPSGRRGRRPLHEFREHAPIGADAYIGPPMASPAKTLSLR